jgi:hypothetical protein
MIYLKVYKIHDKHLFVTVFHNIYLFFTGNLLKYLSNIKDQIVEFLIINEYWPPKAPHGL